MPLKQESIVIHKTAFIDEMVKTYEMGITAGLFMVVKGGGEFPTEEAIAQSLLAFKNNLTKTLPFPNTVPLQ